MSDQWLAAIGMGLGNLFWCWFIVWENNQRRKEIEDE